VEWAQRAERAGFASLGTLDRLVYANYESLIALAAAAAPSTGKNDHETGDNARPIDPGAPRDHGSAFAPVLIPVHVRSLP